ncbi:hypothetical protein [Botrimarina sp.]|uniref:hypothetical protein n=1 Tax=Botrimarina sp. TaxID=2795802 RepID=UPI0032EFD236
MPSQTTVQREAAWLTLAELANVLDISQQLARRELPRRVPESAIRRGRPMRLHGRTAVECYLRDRLAPPPAAFDGFDDLFVGELD